MKRPPPPTPTPSKTQLRLLKLYALTIEQRCELMMRNRDTSKVDREQERLMLALEKAGFDNDNIYLAIYDLGLLKD